MALRIRLLLGCRAFPGNGESTRKIGVQNQLRVRMASLGPQQAHPTINLPCLAPRQRQKNTVGDLRTRQATVDSTTPSRFE